jgi:hypothetical protein
MGKKLLATGNGRCNLDNENIAPECYFTSDPVALEALLQTVNAADPLAWFGSLGLLTRTDEAGRIYPYSNQAADVVNLLLHRLDAFGVEQRTGCRFESLAPKRGGYSVTFRNADGQNEFLYADAVICALGGKAGPQFGTDGFGPDFAAQCGIRCTPLYPCLVPLQCTKSEVQGLAGVRVRADASLWDGAVCCARESGEIQFTDYGLSGIAVMQLSGLLAPNRAPKQPILALDLLPQWDEVTLTNFLTARAQQFSNENARTYMTGLLHPAVGAAVWRAAGGAEGTITPSTSVFWAKLAHVCKHWCFTGLTPCDWRTAQTTGGGIALRELEEDSFQLKHYRGLYFIGETVDCAGSCGGFNLHWAFGSGLAAGRHAAATQGEFVQLRKSAESKKRKKK